MNNVFYLNCKVHVRLGDLMKFNSSTAKSIEEYKLALDIRLKICEPHDR